MLTFYLKQDRFVNIINSYINKENIFNENGYKFIAEKIVEFINENEVK